MFSKSLNRSVTPSCRRLDRLRDLVAAWSARRSVGPGDRMLRIVVGLTPICGLAGVRLLAVLAGPAGIHIV